MLRNSLHAALIMLGWSCWCLSTVVSFHMKENQLHKGGTMYGEWLDLHHVLAGKLCYMLGTTVKLSMLFKFWDYSGIHSGWKNTLLKVHWAQQRKYLGTQWVASALTLQSKAYTKRSNLRIELCLWIYTIYPVLQCQSWISMSFFTNVHCWGVSVKRGSTVWPYIQMLLD